MHYNRAVAAVLISALSFLFIVASNADGRAEPIDCDKSAIQTTLEGAYSPGQKACSKKPFSDPSVSGGSYYRFLRIPGGFANVIYFYYLGTDSTPKRTVTEALNYLHNYRKQAKNKSDTQELITQDKTYETQKFDLPNNRSCIGFARFFTPYVRGYRNSVRGYICNTSGKIEQQELERFLSHLNVRAVSN